MELQTKNLPELIAWVKQEEFSLNLPSDRLAFLLAAAASADEDPSVELTEAQLHDSFRIVSDMFGQMDETQVERANNAINDFSRQHLFIRFGGDSVGSDSVYRLTPLAIGLVDFYSQQKAYSNIKLSILLTQVAAEIDLAYQAAKRGGDQEYWQTQVFGILKHSVQDIFERIDLTQRAMDNQQQAVKSEVATLLHQDWSQAISGCEKLLRETSVNLKELQDTLAAAGDQLQSGLLNIQETLAGKEELAFIESLTFSLQSRLDAIISWGQQAIDLWSRYDRHVHKFIRTAIDMDKNRAFSQRLRDSIGNFQDHAWCLTLAQERRLLELRDETLFIRDNEVMGDAPMEVEYQELVDINAELTGRIQAYLAEFKAEDKPIELANLLRDYLAEFPDVQHFDIAKLVVDEATKLGYSGEELALTGAQPMWQPVNPTGAKIQAHPIDKY